MNKYLLKAALCMLLSLLVSSAAFATRASVIHNYSDKIWFVIGQATKGHISFSNCQHYINQQDYCGIAPHGEIYINYRAAGDDYDGDWLEGKITLKDLNEANLSYTFNYIIKHSNGKNDIEIISPSPTNAITTNKPANGSFTLY